MHCGILSILFNHIKKSWVVNTGISKPLCLFDVVNITQSRLLRSALIFATVFGFEFNFTESDKSFLSLLLDSFSSYAYLPV